MSKKNYLISIKLTKELYNSLHQLSQATGVSKSQLIRQLIEKPIKQSLYNLQNLNSEQILKISIQNTLIFTKNSGGEKK